MAIQLNGQSKVSHMNSVKTAAMALAVGAGLAFSGGVAAASPDSDPGVQCTRQYVVTSPTTLRDSPGGAVTLSVYKNDKLNVPNPSGVWYEGHLYDAQNTFLGYGFVMASALTYTGICF